MPERIESRARMARFQVRAGKRSALLPEKPLRPDLFRRRVIRLLKQVEAGKLPAAEVYVRLSALTIVQTAAVVDSDVRDEREACARLAEGFACSKPGKCRSGRMGGMCDDCAAAESIASQIRERAKKA